jgi:hypothetical protein
MSYSETVAQSRRICILRLLEGQAEYQTNESVLQMALEQFGFAESRDKIRTDLAWLEEQGVITTRDVGDKKLMVVAQLTPRGADVAKGRVTVPGIQRPSPDNAI